VISENTSNPDAQYLKSIKIDVPNFEGRHDPQLFIDWTLQLDRYFIWYELTESRKIKYTAMKLSGQASQYWINLENGRASRGRPPIDTWDRMKEELETNYVPPRLVFISWSIDTNTLKITNLQMSMSRNSMNSSSDAVPSIRKVKLKFLNLEPALEMTYKLNC